MFELIIQHAISEIRRLQGNIDSTPIDMAIHKGKRWPSGERKYSDEWVNSKQYDAEKAREDQQQWKDLLWLIEKVNREAGL